MKICFIRTPPRECYLAFSGGIDSVVLLKLLLSKKIDVKLLWINHHTTWCQTEHMFVTRIANKYNLELIVKDINPFDKSTSLECFWSRERNKIYQSMDRPVLVGLTLDDCLEWYIMSTFQGQPKIIDYRNGNILRPMILVEKSKIIEYSSYYGLEFITDPSNLDDDFNLRNKVRNSLVPKALKCFPGLRKTVSKLVRKKEFENGQQGPTKEGNEETKEGC